MQFGISECLAHWARYRSDHIAVYHNGECLTYRALDELVSSVATSVNSVPVKSNRVALLVRKKIDTLVGMLGIVRAGRSAVLLNSGLPLTTIGTNLEDTNPDALLLDPAFDSSDAFKHLATTLPFPPALITTGPSCDVQWPSACPEDEWGIFFSSGTTGTPKAIERSHHSVVTELIGWCLELGLGKSTTFYIGRPVYYTGGAVLSLATVLNGGSLVLNDVYDERQFPLIWDDYQAVLSKTPVTLAFFIPDQIRSFVETAAKAELVNPSVCVLVMGGPITGDEKLQAASILGSTIVESWGNSESLGTITECEDLQFRPNSIGRPFVGDYMCIVDQEGRKLPPGQMGHIAGALEAGFDGYSKRPDATQHAKRFDLLVSEDIGYTDAEGYFYVQGRVQDSFVSSGETVFTTSLESQIRALQEVLECCVIATSDEEDDTVFLGAVIVPRPGSDDERLHELLLRVSSILSRAGCIVATRLVAAIPRLPSGKPDKVAVTGMMRTARFSDTRRVTASSESSQSGNVRLATSD